MGAAGWSGLRQLTYAVLAVVGAIGTVANNIAHDGSALGFLADATATPAARSVSIDLVVLAAACLVLVVAESRRLGIRWWWAYLVLCAVVAAAFAIPLWLLVRERALERRRRDRLPSATTVAQQGPAPA